jgi:hypothetical protein
LKLTLYWIKRINNSCTTFINQTSVHYKIDMIDFFIKVKQQNPKTFLLYFTKNNDKIKVVDVFRKMIICILWKRGRWFYFAPLRAAKDTNSFWSVKWSALLTSGKAP